MTSLGAKRLYVTSARPDSDSPYSFDRTRSFEIYKAGLGLSDEEIEPHLKAIEGMLCEEPEEWSVPAKHSLRDRIAISERTPYSEHALRVVFRIEGKVVKFIVVGLRDGQSP
jgi:hypothetical protein